MSTDKDTKKTLGSAAAGGTLGQERVGSKKRRVVSPKKKRKKKIVYGARRSPYTSKDSFMKHLRKADADSIRELGDAELLSFHGRLHHIVKLAGREECANGHMLVVSELIRRGFRHETKDELDSDARAAIEVQKAAKRVEEIKDSIRKAPEVITLGKEFVSIVGATLGSADVIIGTVNDDLIVREVGRALGDITKVSDNPDSPLSRIPIYDVVLKKREFRWGIEEEEVEKGLRIMPGLRSRSPKYQLQRLKEKKPAGILLRYEQEKRLGELVALMGHEDDRVYGIVRMTNPRQFSSIDKLGTLKAAVNPHTLEDFRDTKDFYFHPFELVQSIEPPLKPRSVGKGRMWVSDVKIVKELEGGEDVVAAAEVPSMPWEIVFLGTGPSKRVVKKGKSGRTRSSVLVKGAANVLIGCSPDFNEQVEREKVKDISYCLLTHGHLDVIGGLDQLDSWLAKSHTRIPVYAEEGTWDIITRKFGKLRNIQKKVVKPGLVFVLKGINVVPFRVIHSIQKGFPTVGFNITLNGKTLVYSEDLGHLPEDSERYVKGADYWLLDAAMFFGSQVKGHQSAGEAIGLAKGLQVKSVILMRAGRTYPVHEEAEEKIQKYWGKTRDSSKMGVALAYDGLRIVLGEDTIEKEYDIYNGVDWIKSAVAKVFKQLDGWEEKSEEERVADIYAGLKKFRATRPIKNAWANDVVLWLEDREYYEAILAFNKLQI